MRSTLLLLALAGILGVGYGGRIIRSVEGENAVDNEPNPEPEPEGGAGEAGALDDNQHCFQQQAMETAGVADAVTEACREFLIRHAELVENGEEDVSDGNVVDVPDQPDLSQIVDQQIEQDLDQNEAEQDLLDGPEEFVGSPPELSDGLLM